MAVIAKADSGLDWTETAGKGGGPSEEAKGTTKAPAEGRTLTLTAGEGNVTVKAGDPSATP